MRLLDQLTARYRAQGFFEGLASGAAVYSSIGSDPRREGSVQQIVAVATEAYESYGVVFACLMVRMMVLAEASFKFRSAVRQAAVRQQGFASARVSVAERDRWRAVGADGAVELARRQRVRGEGRNR